jgi:hypothetical protein
MSVPLLGRARHVRTAGDTASLALLRCGAGVRWAKLDLAWEFGSPGHVGAALRKQPAFFQSCGGAAAVAGGGGGHEKANGF